MGQQSDKMTLIAQEARELADDLDSQATAIVGDAADAKNKSIEVYELVKKANADQSLIKEKTYQLQSDIERAEEKLNKTVTFTNDISDNAREIKNEALEILNEVNNLFVPTVNVPELNRTSNDLRRDAESLKEKAEALFGKR